MRRGVAEQLRSRRSLSARTSALLGRGDGAARSVDLRAARVAVDNAGTRQTSRIARLFHEGEVLIIARLTGPATGVAVRTVAAGWVSCLYDSNEQRKLDQAGTSECMNS